MLVLKDVQPSTDRVPTRQVPYKKILLGKFTLRYFKHSDWLKNVSIQSNCLKKA